MINSQRFVGRELIALNNKLDKRTSFPIKINYMDKKYKNFIVINEYFKLEVVNTGPGSYYNSANDLDHSYVMHEVFNEDETTETYNKFKILKLNYKLLKGILNNSIKKIDIETLFNIINIKNSNNKSFYNIENNNLDYNVKDNVNEVYNDFINEMDNLPGIGNEYNKSKKSFESQK